VHDERSGDVRLVVCGDGPLKHLYRRQLEDRAAADVHWAGRIDWSRPSYYRSADVLCIPCQRAACSMVPLEGMATGVPVVASRIPGFELAIDHGRHGLLVDDFLDPSAFAEPLLELLDQPDTRMHMGLEGRRRALDVYSVDVVTRQYEELYERLLERPSAAEPFKERIGTPA
jgi:glycosyltransferase involved in cell wall biosynthesis